METLKSILAEGTSMLNSHSIPVFLFQLFLLIVLVIAVKFLYKKKHGDGMTFPLMSFAMSLGIMMPFVKYSNAIAIVFLGVCVLLSKSIELEKKEIPFIVVGLVTALAVASGFWVLGLIGWTVAVMVLLLSKK